MASQEPKQQNRFMGELQREASYEGRPGQTHAELHHYSCSCGAIYPVNVLQAVNVSTDRELAEAAVAGSLNHNQCPYCSRQFQIDVPYVLHHPSEERFVLVIPESQRHRELNLRSELLSQLAEATESPVSPYVAEFQVVFDTEGLRLSLSRPPNHVQLREELTTRQQELEEREGGVTENERLQSLREAKLSEKERAVEQQEESVMMREERLKERGEKLTRREDDLRQQEASQQARREALEVRFQMLEQRESDLNQREQTLTVRSQTLQEWETRLQSLEQQVRNSSSEVYGPPAGSGGTMVTPPPMHSAAGDKSPVAPEQDIITSLMHDPEHDESSADSTQRRRALTSTISDRLAEDEAEELTDDDLDLIEEAEELSADDLIEGEAELGSPVPAEPRAFGAETPLEGSDSSALPVFPGFDKAPPVAPPPAGMSARPPRSGASDLSPPPAGPSPAPQPEPEPQPESQPEPAEPAAPAAPAPVEEAPQAPAKPFLDPPPQWVRSGENTMLELLGDDVYLLARVDEGTAEKIKADSSDLWVQLHLMPTYPLITLTLLYEPDDEDPKGLHWFLDIEEDKDRRLLQQLRRRFRTNVLLYDLSYSLLDEVVFEVPREVNVAHVVDRATQELGEIGPSKLSPVQARTQFHDEWDWGGKKRHPFTEDAYAEISSVSEAKLALGILSYWSEPENHEYLVLTKSVPVDLFDTITRRILDGAIRYGLWLPQPLKERAVALALATDLGALVKRLTQAFAELGPEPEGLELAEAAENWQRLLRDADELDLSLDKKTVELAEEIIERVAATDESEEEVEPLSREELEELGDDEVLRLLERRVTRTTAALVLAKRGNPDHLEALFRAARKMGRPDLVRLVPALLEFGDSAGDYFVEGLTARKSFTRQACAIALGELKLRRAVVPLLHQLIAEKTPVWHEIARALGRYGATGIKPLHRYLRDPKGKEDRLVRAMAYFAINKAVKQVQSIASGDDGGMAALAQKALKSRDEAREVEEQVRGNSEIEGQAPLLRFSRRLYQAIAGEDQGGDDELLEELGDSDIMELEDNE